MSHRPPQVHLAVCCLSLLALLHAAPRAAAQGAIGAGPLLQVSGTVARAFGGSGYGAGVSVGMPTSLAAFGAQHRVGPYLLTAFTDITSANPHRRRLAGAGFRWEAAFGAPAGGPNFMLAVPVVALSSRVPDYDRLLGGAAGNENLVGTKWGAGAGLELGLGVPVTDRWEVLGWSRSVEAAHLRRRG